MTWETDVTDSLNAILVAIGTPSVVDGCAPSISDMLRKIIDDNAGNDFDATHDSLHELYTKLKYTIYQSGIWVDTNNGIGGSTIGDNGTPWNPVNNYSDAYILATALGVRRFYFAPDCAISLENSHDDWEFIGKGELDLNGQSIADAEFNGLERITGISTGDDAKFVACHTIDATLGAALFHDCILSGTLALVALSTYTFHQCVSTLTTGEESATPNLLMAPIISFAGDNNVGFRDWSGEIELSNMGSTDSAVIDGAGHVLIHSNCTGGEITVRGNFTITDEVVGGFQGTIIYDTNTETISFLKACQNGELILEDNTPEVGKVTLKLYSTDATPVLLSTTVVTKATGHRAGAI